MGIIYFLVPASLLLVAVALFGYIWAVRSGQFDDTATPPLRMLADDRERPRGQPSPEVSAANDSVNK